MPTTPRLALPYPVLGDAANVPADMGALATPLDAAALWGQGAASARPTSTPGSPGITGRFWYATDTGVLSFDMGTGWITMGLSVDRGTSFPASPADKMLFTYQADAANGLEWLCQYRTGQPKPWEVLGPQPLFAEVTTPGSVTGTGYADISGSPGPSIVIPRAGDYRPEVGFTGWHHNSGDVAMMSYAIGATAAVDADAAKAGVTAAGASVSRPRPAKSLSAVTLTAKYRSTGGAGGGEFENRWVRVTPVRLS